MTSAGMMRPQRTCAAPDCANDISFLRPQATTCSSVCRHELAKVRKRGRRAELPVVLDVDDGYFEALDADRGYVTDWEPRAKTQIMLGQVEDILGQYSAQLPLTVRQVYYRMVAKYGHPKGKRFERALYGALDKARRSRRIDFADIRDDGIMGGAEAWFADHEQMLRYWRNHARGYNRDVQIDQPGARIQVWCEAAGMVPQVVRVADRYSIPVYSSGGFSSLTAVRQVVASCIEDTDGPTTVLHLGDCDPSGASIFQAVFEDVSAFLQEDRRLPGQTFHAERVAITPAQMADPELGLSADAITTDDSRSQVYKRRGITHKVELEALDPATIAKLLTEAIERHVDLHAIDAVRDLEPTDREALAEAIDAAEQATRVPVARERMHRLIERWHPPGEPSGARHHDGSGADDWYSEVAPWSA